MTQISRLQGARPRRLQRSLRLLRNAHDRVRHSARLNQAGQTPYEVIARHDIISLRHYPGDADKALTPLVIVPPLAVNMLIYDLFPQRSLVRHLRDQGFPLYLIDWGRPTRAHAHWRFADYLQDFLPRMLDEVRRHSGQQELSLHGWSLGAMFSYAYAALGDPHIRNVVLLGPPCDYHAPGGVSFQNRLVSRQMKQIRRLTGWRIHASRPGLWHVPGWANAMAFKLASPAGTLRGYTALLGRLDDRDYVSEHATHGAFLDDMVAYPGGVMQDIVQYLMTDNVLAAGRLPIAQCKASLADVKANVLIVVGDKDPIVTPAASRHLIGLMPQAEAELLEAPGGHMSIVSGSQAPHAIWTPAAAWLRERSTVRRAA